jgi:Glycosidases
MSYTFDLLGGEPSRTYIEKTLQTFEAGAGDAWPCWALSNHDVTRHATRHLPFAQNPAQRGKLMAALHLCLRGSVCIYEGDELGLTEADLAFEDLVDPTASASGRSSRAATAAARRWCGSRRA